MVPVEFEPGHLQRTLRFVFNTCLGLQTSQTWSELLQSCKE